ncbi:hypothetical protein RF11_01069 [Thelohanellus kitauei]|uniref:Tc1-like transposase DDE domain-containing protein n=1 Tax=Thelohanellus kitauei TaxID=669202 RepID=A0A0C2ITH4_THEKT|nr:hypothetical protein RF11_01069 [Thelohanellus kitauei]
MEVSRLLGVPKSTVQNSVRRYEVSKSNNPGKRGGPYREMLTDEICEQLCALANNNEAMTLKKCKIAYMLKSGLTKLNFTYKMTLPVYEMRNDMNVKTTRIEYVLWYNSLSQVFRYKNLIFIDETQFEIHKFGSYLRVKCGVTSPSPTRKPKLMDFTMLVAINGTSVINCQTLTTGVYDDVVQAFIDEIAGLLGSEEDFVLIMDKKRFHNTIDLGTHPNFLIRCLPAHSPSLNRREKVFTFVKNNVRRETFPESRNDLLGRMTDVCRQLNNTNISGYFSQWEGFLEDCITMKDIVEN